eukprot:748108-Hanusia_phi.AAC.1
MLMVKRLQKSALRDETKELIDKLDQLVPAKKTIRKHRSLLKSGRSITQLLSDVHQKVTTCLNSTTTMEPERAQDQMYREILTSTMQPLLLINSVSQTVVSMSRGFQKLCENSRTLKRFPLGQHVRFFVHPKYLISDGCKSEDIFSAGLILGEIVNFLAIRDHSVTFHPCTLETTTRVSEKFMLLVFKEMNPRPLADIFDSLIPSTVRFGWSVFSFDLLSSTCFPCDIERNLRRSEMKYVEGSFMLGQMCNLWKEASFEAELEKIARRHRIRADMVKALSLQTAVKVSWEDEFPCCSVMFRFKVPPLYGTFETRWLQETKIILDGRPHPAKGNFESLFHLQADHDGAVNNTLQLVELRTTEVCNFNTLFKLDVVDRSEGAESVYYLAI